MKIFRRLCFVLVLAAAFAIPVMAGETQGPGCANPGETQTPPGETQAPPCVANPDIEEPSNVANGNAEASIYVAPGEVDTPTFEALYFLIQTIF